MDNFALFECEKERKKFVKNEYVREQCFHDCFTTIPDRLSFDDRGDRYCERLRCIPLRKKNLHFRHIV